MKNVMMMGMILLGTAAFAQRGGGDVTPEKRAERQTAMMSEKLGLSADQQKQVYALQLTRTQKMQEMREAQDQSADARARMKSANDDFEKSLGAILNADQKVKYEAMQAEMRQGRRGGSMEKGKDSSEKKGKKSRGTNK
ncbi:DUF4890 domain-containing protein [Persicitalea jodogahamensis]|nr:DUF4890 domain-containing protein [Persicitalea jodogahamensis]